MVLAALAAASEPDLGGSLEQLKAKLLGKYAEDHVGTTVTTVLVASLLFYRAERGSNPKVRTYTDALSYIATSLSVGYSDIFPKTDAGKSIGAAVATFGPAMTANMFEDLGLRKDEGQQAVVERLDRILVALEARGKA